MSVTVEARVISLTRAVERRRLIAGQFADLGVPWSFFDAHTSLENPRLLYDETVIRHRFGRTLSPQELAVWSSHYTVMQAFAEEGRSDYLLVFEDDVIFDTAFPLTALADLCRARGIHYIRLFGMYHAPAVRLSFFYDRSIIRYRSSPAGGQAYLLSRQGARQMLEGCRRIETALDVAIDLFWKTGLPIYSVFPFPVIERFSPSSNPMKRDRPLTGRERAIWTANRARNRLAKMAGNLRLVPSDRQLRRSQLPFRQIGESDLKGD